MTNWLDIINEANERAEEEYLVLATMYENAWLVDKTGQFYMSLYVRVGNLEVGKAEAIDRLIERGWLALAPPSEIQYRISPEGVEALKLHRFNQARTRLAAAGVTVKRSDAGVYLEARFMHMPPGLIADLIFVLQEIQNG